MRSSLTKMLVVAVLISPVMTMAACKSKGGTSDGGGRDLAQPVAITEGVTGSSEALAGRGVFLVKTDADYQKMGGEGLYPGGVDFAKNDLVVMAGGEVPTGGYWVRISSIQQVGDELYVVGVANKPGEDETVTQAITYPYHAVLIDKTTATLVVPDIKSVSGKSPNEG